MCYANSAAQAQKYMSDGSEVCDIRTIFGQGWATSTLHEKSQVASRATFDPHSAPPCSAELVLVEFVSMRNTDKGNTPSMIQAHGTDGKGVETAKQ